jgi:hypothetical protein
MLTRLKAINEGGNLFLHPNHAAVSGRDGYMPKNEVLSKSIGVRIL